MGNNHPAHWSWTTFISLESQRHNMKILSLLILFIINAKGFEITGGSDDPLIAAGDQLELNCEIDGHFDFCQWSYSDAWSCLTFSNAIDEELPCEDQERGTITASEGACTLVLEDITLDDIGEYTCMSAKIDGIDVQKSVKLFNVDVAMPASIEFGGDIADVEETWMLLEDEEVTLLSWKWRNASCRNFWVHWI